MAKSEKHPHVTAHKAPIQDLKEWLQSVKETGELI